MNKIQEVIFPLTFWFKENPFQVLYSHDKDNAIHFRKLDNGVKERELKKKKNLNPKNP